MTMPSVIRIIAVLYFIANGYAFLLFAYDKRKAARTEWRIPERTLLASAAIGPAGAFVAMNLFRHKTQKLTFFLVPVFLVIHCLLIFWIVSRFW